MSLPPEVRMKSSLTRRSMASGGLGLLPDLIPAVLDDCDAVSIGHLVFPHILAQTGAVIASPPSDHPDNLAHPPRLAVEHEPSDPPWRLTAMPCCGSRHAVG